VDARTIKVDTNSSLEIKISTLYLFLDMISPETTFTEIKASKKNDAISKMIGPSSQMRQTYFNQKEERGERKYLLIHELWLRLATLRNG